MNGFARIFKFRVLSGQDESYRDYLRNVVTPIDDVAHAQGVFDRLFTVIPRRVADWNHGRVFVFRDAAQREAFTTAMAECALAFDGSKAARDARKAHADTLRVLVAVEDYDFSGTPD